MEIRHYVEKNDHKLTTQQTYGMQAMCALKLPTTLSV